MMKSKILALFMLTAFLWIGVSCNKDESNNASLEINFQLQYDGTPLVAFDEYDYPLGYSMIVSKFTMFLSDLVLHGENSHELTDAVFMDLAASQFDEASAENGTSFLFENLAPGDYTSLSVNLGLPPSVNATTPDQYSSTHPLANTAEYWSGWESYIFHKTEAKLDLDDDGVHEFSVALHIGSDQAFVQRDIPLQLTLENDQVKQLKFVIDLKDMYQLDGSPYDFEARPQVHSLDHIPHVVPVVESLINQL